MFEILEKIESESFGIFWKKDELKKLYNNDKYHFVIFADKDEIKGFSIYIKVIDEIEIIRLAVAKKYRRNGFASKILQEIFDREENCKIFLEVREKNISAKHLYLKAGFEEVGVRKKYYPDTGENAIVMLKEVDHAIKR